MKLNPNIAADQGLAVAHPGRRHHPQSVPALAGPPDEGLRGCEERTPAKPMPASAPN